MKEKWKKAKDKRPDIVVCNIIIYFNILLSFDKIRKFDEILEYERRQNIQNQNKLPKKI